MRVCMHTCVCVCVHVYLHACVCMCIKEQSHMPQFGVCVQLALVTCLLKNIHTHKRVLNEKIL